MKARVLIVAYHPNGLLPIFRQPAVVRMACLAASLADEVWVFLTEEVDEGLKEVRVGLPTSVSCRVLSGAERLKVPLPFSPQPDEPLVILKGHAVWDRSSLGGILASASRDTELLESWGGILPERRWAPIVQRWLTEPEEAFSSLPAPAAFSAQPWGKGGRARRGLLNSGGGRSYPGERRVSHQADRPPHLQKTEPHTGPVGSKA